MQDNHKIVITVKQTLMEIVQSINPGQTSIPKWVYLGAIIGVQGGTQRMLDIMNQVSEPKYVLSSSIGKYIED